MRRNSAIPVFLGKSSKVYVQLKKWISQIIRLELINVSRPTKAGKEWTSAEQFECDKIVITSNNKQNKIEHQYWWINCHFFRNFASIFRFSILSSSFYQYYDFVTLCFATLSTYYSFIYFVCLFRCVQHIVDIVMYACFNINTQGERGEREMAFIFCSNIEI